MNKPVYLGLMYEFWYDYVKTKYWKCKNLWYGYRRLCSSCKTEGIYKDIAENVETRLVTWNHELNRPLAIGKIKNLMD